MHCDLVLVADRVVLPDGERPAAVGVRDGRVVVVSGLGDVPAADRVVRLAADEVLLPGLVDTHVHLQDPGHTDWEDAASATRAAALGGVTTLVDMPLDCDPVTTSVGALAAKREALAGRCRVDVGFWGGAVPGSLGSLGALVEAGVLGHKAFLCPTGLAEFPPLSDAGLRAALAELAPLGVPLLVHAEDETQLPPAPAGDDGRAAGRPGEVETAAVRAVVDAAAATGGWAHVVHVSAGGSLPLLAAARAEGVRMTAETCPHYLLLAADAPGGLPAGAAAQPPVRAAADREQLWDGLAAGVLDLVASDHSPCAPGSKDGAVAAPGVSSLQQRLPLLWTAARRRGHGLDEVVRWAARGPADLAGLPGKGRIAVGADADLCVLAPDETIVVGPATTAHRQPATPYDGWRLDGVVRSVWLRGRAIDDAAPRGRLLLRGRMR